jgi:hypothetical protein
MKSDEWNYFWRYFNRTWLTQYKISDWNINGVMSLNNRTNNALERYNRTLNNEFPNAHPSLVTFIQSIKLLTFRQVFELQQICRGIRMEPVHKIPELTIPQEYIDFQYVDTDETVSNSEGSTESSELEETF